MVEERQTDGRRIAQLLASELEGHGGVLAAVAVTDADPDVTPTADGALAYAVARTGDGSGEQEGWAGDGAGEGSDDDRPAGSLDVGRIAEVYVHPDRVRVEFRAGQDVAAEAADARGLRVRPKAVRPPRTLVFVEDGAAVKRALRVFETVVESLAAGTNARGDEPDG